VVPFTFIGTTNLIDGEYVPSEKTVKMDGYEFRVEKPLHDKKTRVILSIRPEDFILSTQDTGGIKCTITDSLFLGLNTHYMVILPGGQTVEIIHESDITTVFNAGDTVFLAIKVGKINIFSKDGARNLSYGN